MSFASIPYAISCFVVSCIQSRVKGVCFAVFHRSSSNLFAFSNHSLPPHIIVEKVTLVCSIFIPASMDHFMTDDRPANAIALPAPIATNHSLLSIKDFVIDLLLLTTSSPAFQTVVHILLALSQTLLKTDDALSSALITIFTSSAIFGDYNIK